MVSSEQLLVLMTLIATVGCGLVAGVFFAFSTFVMKALHRLPFAEGIAAMQSINVVVLNRWFLGAFFGTAAACLIVLIFSLLRWHDPGAVYRMVGAMLYLVGCFLVTIVFNVPKNRGLASVAPDAPDAKSLWSRYVETWTAWNHVRTATALTAAVSFGITLSLRAPV